MRSSRPRKARAQDDRLKNSFDGIFRIDYYSIDVKRIFFIINEDGKK